MFATNRDALYEKALPLQNVMPSNPPFRAQNGSKYPFLGEKSTETPLKHSKLGINRIIMIFVVY